MPNKFLHDLSNIMAIVDGKVRQVERLLDGPMDPEALTKCRERVKSATAALDRVNELLKNQKLAAMEKKDGA